MRPTDADGGRGRGRRGGPHRRRGGRPRAGGERRPHRSRGGRAPAGAAGAAGAAGKARSASTLRRLVALAEREMAEASDRRRRLEDDLSAVGGDHTALAAVAHALAEAEVALATAEDRWLALTEELGA